MRRQVLDGYPNVIPPSDVSAVRVLSLGNDIEVHPLDSHALNLQRQGPLVGMVKDDEEVLRAVAS